MNSYIILNSIYFVTATIVGVILGKLKNINTFIHTIIIILINLLTAYRTVLLLNIKVLLGLKIYDTLRNAYHFIISFILVFPKMVQQNYRRRYGIYEYVGLYHKYRVGTDFELLISDIFAILFILLVIYLIIKESSLLETIFEQIFNVIWFFIKPFFKVKKVPFLIRKTYAAAQATVNVYRAMLTELSRDELIQREIYDVQALAKGIKFLNTYARNKVLSIRKKGTLFDLFKISEPRTVTIDSVEDVAKKVQDVDKIRSKPIHLDVKHTDKYNDLSDLTSINRANSLKTEHDYDKYRALVEKDINLSEYQKLDRLKAAYREVEKHLQLAEKQKMLEKVTQEREATNKLKPTRKDFSKIQKREADLKKKVHTLKDLTDRKKKYLTEDEFVISEPEKTKSKKFFFSRNILND